MTYGQNWVACDRWVQHGRLVCANSCVLGVSSVQTCEDLSHLSQRWHHVERGGSCCLCGRRGRRRRGRCRWMRWRRPGCRRRLAGCAAFVLAHMTHDTRRMRGRGGARVPRERWTRDGRRRRRRRRELRASALDCGAHPRMPPSDVLVEIGHARKDFGAVGACNRSVFEKFVSAREAELLLEGALPTQDGGGERERERARTGTSCDMWGGRSRTGVPYVFCSFLLFASYETCCLSNASSAASRASTARRRSCSSDVLP